MEPYLHSTFSLCVQDAFYFIFTRYIFDREEKLKFNILTRSSGICVPYCLVDGCHIVTNLLLLNYLASVKPVLCI